MSSDSPKKPEVPAGAVAPQNQAVKQDQARGARAEIVRQEGTPAREAGAKPVVAPKQDVVLATGVTEDRKGVRVIRARDEKLEVGEVRPLEAGKPLTGEVVRLKPRHDAPMICDVETDFSREELDRASGGTRAAGSSAQARRAKAGPPQVANQAYRDNWDAIYSGRTAPGSSELN